MYIIFQLSEEIFLVILNILYLLILYIKLAIIRHSILNLFKYKIYLYLPCEVV